MTQNSSCSWNIWYLRYCKIGWGDNLDFQKLDRGPPIPCSCITQARLFSRDYFQPLEFAKFPCHEIFLFYSIQFAYFLRLSELWILFFFFGQVTDAQIHTEPNAYEPTVYMPRWAQSMLGPDLVSMTVAVWNISRRTMLFSSIRISGAIGLIAIESGH